MGPGNVVRRHAGACALLVVAAVAVAVAAHCCLQARSDAREQAAREVRDEYLVLFEVSDSDSSPLQVDVVRTDEWGNEVAGVVMDDRSRALLRVAAEAYNADPSTTLEVDPDDLERAYREDALETFGGDPSRDAALALWLWMARPADLVYVRDTYDDGGHILEVSGADANSEGAYSNIEFCRAKMDGLSDSMNMRFRWEDQ